MERENLLKGLQGAQSLMNQIISLQNQLGEIQTHIKVELKHRKPLNKVIPCVACIILCFSIMTSGFVRMTLGLAIVLALQPLVGGDNNAIMVLNIINTVSSVGLGIIIGRLIGKFFVKRTEKENLAIDRQNNEIREYNRQVAAHMEQQKQKIYAVQHRYAQEILSWYPQNYCTLDAVEFFINAVANYRASTIQEMVNLYEDHLHKCRMEEGQQQMLKQQKLNNILQVGSIMMQGATIGAINRNTDAVTDAVNDPQYIKDWRKQRSRETW